MIKRIFVTVFLLIVVNLVGKAQKNNRLYKEGLLLYVSKLDTAKSKVFYVQNYDFELRKNIEVGNCKFIYLDKRMLRKLTTRNKAISVIKVFAADYYGGKELGFAFTDYFVRRKGKRFHFTRYGAVNFFVQPDCAGPKGFKVIMGEVSE